MIYLHWLKSLNTGLTMDWFNIKLFYLISDIKLNHCVWWEQNSEPWRLVISRMTGIKVPGEQCPACCCPGVITWPRRWPLIGSVLAPSDDGPGLTLSHMWAPTLVSETETLEGGKQVKNNLVTPSGPLSSARTITGIWNRESKRENCSELKY